MVIDFTEEELENYLNNKRRIVDFVVHFVIDTVDCVVGDVVQE